jgi:hypothetical protein
MSIWIQIFRSSSSFYDRSLIYRSATSFLRSSSPELVLPSTSIFPSPSQLAGLGVCFPFLLYSLRQAVRLIFSQSLSQISCSKLFYRSASWITSWIILPTSMVALVNASAWSLYFYICRWASYCVFRFCFGNTFSRFMEFACTYRRASIVTGICNDMLYFYVGVEILSFSRWMIRTWRSLLAPFYLN